MLRAVALRRKGYSIRDIAERLNVSRSSASVWCRNVLLSASQTAQLVRNSENGRIKGSFLGAATNQRRKLERIAFLRKKGTEDIGVFTSRDMLMVGLGLYWGEGYKAYKGGASLINSDPRIIAFMYQWFREVLQLGPQLFRPQIFINSIHRPRAKKILRFWAHLLKLPESQFRRIVFLKVKNKKVYENYDSYYGVLALRLRNGTDHKYRILGLIDAIANNAGVAQW